ncbi:hypothetical protein DPEC_G00086670 [Dallia pectoralis]|uniref:Uncharacterized protein n=1 Tax=Dallia pectoralis TaxID=75939 RepID=A0ACC2GZM2_DALPE|nr:hypothetical protein DPEC_G00086670 [Dallia pectoralis]
MACNEKLLQMGALWPSLLNNGIVFMLMSVFLYFNVLLSALMDCLVAVPGSTQWQSCASNQVQWELIVAVASFWMLLRIVQVIKPRRYYLTETDILKQLAEMKRLLGESETRTQRQSAEIQSSKQECQDLKMRLNKTVVESAVEEPNFRDPTSNLLHRTNQQTLGKLSEALKMMEERFQHQKRLTCEAANALAIEKQVTNLLHQKIFKLSSKVKDMALDKDISLDKPCKASTSTLKAFKAPPSQDLCGKPTKNGTPCQILDIAPDPGPRRSFRPVSDEDGRQRNCFPFKFRTGKFFRKFRKSSKKEPMVYVLPLGDHDTPHLGVEFP